MTSHAFPGGELHLPGDVSSQFATALMMAAPFGERPSRILMSRPVMSAAYLAQTAAAMRAAGLAVEHADDFTEIVVPPGAPRPVQVRCSGDFTSASYLIAAASILPGSLTIASLERDSLQGEQSILEAVAAMGVSVEWSAEGVTVSNPTGRLAGEYRVDVSSGPNILPTLASTGAYVEGSLTITGGGLTRLHKSDRIAAMCRELGALGASIEMTDDGLVIHGCASYPGDLDLEDHGDHRVLMSLVIASLRCDRPNRISSRLDVEQSFPGFWQHLEEIGWDGAGATQGSEL